MRANRDDSGWKIAEPTPTVAAANKSDTNVDARDSSTSPVSVNIMPIASEYAFG